MTDLIISGRILDEIGEHATALLPEECCGALIGEDAGGRRRIAYAVPLDNAEEERRRTRYLVPPAAIVALEREASGAGLELVGFYHSHPNHPAEPSAIDLAQAWPWYTYMIISPAAERERRVRAWRLSEDGARFEEERLKLAEAEPV